MLASRAINERIATAACIIGVKHIAAHDVGYITNGVFIAAAVAEGFRVVRISEGPNAWLNINERSLRRVSPCFTAPGQGRQSMSAEPCDIVEVFDDGLAEQEALHARLLLHHQADWQALYEVNVRLAERRYGSGAAMGWWETERAWGDLHPEIIPATICAGCRQPIGTGPVIALDMGHSGTKGHYRIDHVPSRFCLNAFDEHRRLTARRALIDLGLNPLKADQTSTTPPPMASCRACGAVFGERRNPMSSLPPADPETLSPEILAQAAIQMVMRAGSAATARECRIWRVWPPLEDRPGKGRGY